MFFLSSSISLIHSPLMAPLTLPTSPPPQCCSSHRGWLLPHSHLYVTHKGLPTQSCLLFPAAKNCLCLRLLSNPWLPEAFFSSHLISSLCSSSLLFASWSAFNFCLQVIALGKGSPTCTHCAAEMTWQHAPRCTKVAWRKGWLVSWGWTGQQRDDF